MSEKASDLFIYILVGLVHSVYYLSTSCWISHPEEMVILAGERLGEIF